MLAMMTRWTWIAGVLALGTFLHGQGSGQRSPFLPPNAAPAAGQAVGPNGIELHGVMSTSAGTKYDLYDPAKKAGVWIALNQEVDGIRVTAGNPEIGSVTISVNGQMADLALKQVKTTAGISGPMVFGNVPTFRATPAEEQRRLQAVADEVRRRRLLREQAERQQQQ